MSVVLHGIPIGGGIAIGKAHLLQQTMDDVPHWAVEPENMEQEVARFEGAIKETRRQLEQLRKDIPENAPSELGAFIALHLMLLTDVTLSREPIDIMKSMGCNAEWALKLQTEKLSEQFDAIEDKYLRERKQDMLQVVERIFKNLRGVVFDLGSEEMFGDTILIAADLSPADTIYFKENRIAAFITDLGGPTSHTAILGRSLDIPSVIALHNARRLITEDEWVIVDGIDGVVILEPTDEILAEYRTRARHFQQKRRKLSKLKKSTAKTLDNIDIEILANIETVEDATMALKNTANGVGLFRSEFLFLNRDTQPDEEEQYETYSKIAKKLGDKAMVIRTVDLGADKNPRWFGNVQSQNPALGLTGIRLCLAEPVLFRTQMRAILRAAQHGNIMMMWPMISSLTELKQCIGHLETAKQQLREKIVDFNEDIKIGIMIEIPAAALAVQTLLKYVDFISIGTNDLIQYTMAVDRGNDAVSYLYQPTHPAVLKLLNHVIKTANRMNKSVSVCGEVAGDPFMTRILLGMGLRRFSMHPSSILRIKQNILETNCAEIENMVLKILRAEDPEKIHDLATKLNSIVCHPEIEDEEEEA